MKKTIDLTYLCANIAHLINMPVRLLDGDEQGRYFGAITLPRDPFDIYRREIFAITEHVGYFFAPHDYYYGVVNFGHRRIVVGPTGQIPVPEHEIKALAFEAGVPHADVDDFVRGMKSVARMPLTTLLQWLALINHIVGEGETLSLTDMAISEPEQARMVEYLAQEAVERTVQAIDDGEMALHNTMDVEGYILSAVSRGDVQGLKAFFAQIPAVNTGIMAQNTLRQDKNLLIVTATLVSREAIRGGMDAEEALALSDSYIQKCELQQSAAAITNLNYRMVLDYTERMEALQYGGAPSRLTTDVVNYVRHHLSEPVTVEALARHLCKGRSRLSTDFKRETGENLSQFVLKLKIEESKRLLRYTDKPSTEIALYLGFSSQSHFSRTFRRYVGASPNEYRTTATRRDP